MTLIGRHPALDVATAVSHDAIKVFDDVGGLQAVSVGFAEAEFVQTQGIFQAFGQTGGRLRTCLFQFGFDFVDPFSTFRLCKSPKYAILRFFRPHA